MATSRRSIMTKMSEPIVFFGSGPVAAASLRLLHEHCTIEAVITKPRAAHHKGDVPVIALAEELGLPTLTASNKRTLDALFASHPVSSKLAVLIDFGIIVSQQIIDYFPLGILNSHFSLLPEWRGADPITFSLLSGQAQTGVSLMLLTAGMDEGPLLAQAAHSISPTTTALELTRDLIEISDAQLQVLLPLYISGEAIVADQQAISISTIAEPTYSRKLTKEDGQLDWEKPAAMLEREIRAFIEWPKSRTLFGDLPVIITKAHVIEHNGTPGTREIIDKQPVVNCNDQALVIERIKPAGKKEMTGEAFLAGYKKLFLSDSI
jgi:methionyl-tRNA formyltransferase